MEETLGKRIVACRKRLGLTQDALAEQLGVTAQAVSKWENDQSCPDITMLPKLAQLFDISTDELLGLDRKAPVQAEIVIGTESDEAESDGIHFQQGNWELKWDSGRKSGIGFGVWLLLTGGLMIPGVVNGVHVGLFDLLVPTGLLVFGLFGIYPRFSIFRLGCCLLGASFLLDLLELIPFSLNLETLLPIFLLLTGLHLVVRALRKPKRGTFHAIHNGEPTSRNHCTYDGECFDCETNFGENRYLITLPRLAKGCANVSFGEMHLDLSGCEELAEGCRLDLNCAFGELEILVPRRWKAVPVTSTSFASVETNGIPNADAEATLELNCCASFGEITIRYI